MRGTTLPGPPGRRTLLFVGGLVCATLIVVWPMLSESWNDRVEARRLDQAERLYLADQPDDALATYDRILGQDLASTADPGSPAELSRAQVRALLGRAEVLTGARGDFESARRDLDRALAEARRIADPSLEADALGAQGLFFWYYQRQRHRPLDEFYRPALELYRAAGDRRGEAEALGWIGLVHLARSDYGAAARHFEASRDLYQVLGDDDGLCAVHRFLGALQGSLERTDLALRHFDRGLEHCRRTGNLRGLHSVESLRAFQHLRLGEFDRTLEILEPMLTAEGPPSPRRRDTWMTRGNALLHLDDFDAARESYQRALDIDAELPGADGRFRANTLGMLAHVEMRVGDLERSAAALELAEALPIASKGWGATVTHVLARADLAHQRGRPEEALRHLVLAAEIEGRTYGSARSHFFRTQYQQVFDRLVSLLFDGVLPQGQAEALAFRTLEQMRYRSFRSLVVRLGAPTTGERVPTETERQTVARIEGLTRAGTLADPERWGELQQAYAEYEDIVLRSELGSERHQLLAEGRPIELEALRASLEPGDTLVELVVSPPRVFALVIDTDGISSVVLPVDPETLEAKIKLFRHQVFVGAEEARAHPDAWRPLARDLGRLLLDPLEEAAVLETTERLILVPMGTLHDLPFAALVDATGRTLAERFVLVRTPSATRWARPRRGVDPPGAHTLPIFALGLRNPAGAGLAPLLHTEDEALAVAARLGGEARVAEQATEASLQRLGPGARRLHLATHGLAEPRLPLHSRLLLADGDGHDGNLTVREILDSTLNAELVVLSACGTGLSPATGGLGLEVDRLGFVEAFLHAGASAVVASLLSVSDAETAALMERFYRHLEDGSPESALATARRELLVSGAPETEATDAALRHPRAWAPWIVVVVAPSPTRSLPRSDKS